MDSITVNNLMPFIIGDVHAHVDRILRDKGMMNQEVAAAIMSFTRSEFLDKYIEHMKEHYRVNAIGIKLSRKENVINKKDTIPADDEIDSFIGKITESKTFSEIRTGKYILRINPII